MWSTWSGSRVVEVEHHPQGVDQRERGRVADQRHLVAGHLDRHAGGAEGTTQRRDGLAAGPHQHGHLVPRDAVLEVRAPEQVGQVLGLGPVAVEGADGDPTFAVVSHFRGGRQERLASTLGDASGQPDPTGEPLRGGEQPRSEPAGGPQRHHLGWGAVGSWEGGREVEDTAHLRAPERVDRLVRVAHHHQVTAVTGDRPQQRHLAGVGVLVLVDEDVGVGRAQLVAVHRRLDRRAPNEVGVVDGAAPVEDREVLLQERSGRHELRQTVGLAQPLELLPVEALLPGSGQHGVDLAREATGAERVPELVGPPDRLGVVLQQLTQHHVLLGRREQPERADVELGGRVAADQAVGEGVERRADARGHGAADPRGDPVAELLGRLAREGQRQDPVGVGALVDAADDRLDQRRGLAGARPGQDQERPAVVVGDPLLLLVEDRRLTGERRPDQAVGGRGLRHRTTPSRGADTSSGHSLSATAVARALLCSSPSSSMVPNRYHWAKKDLSPS